MSRRQTKSGDKKEIASSDSASSSPSHPPSSTAVPGSFQASSRLTSSSQAGSSSQHAEQQQIRLQPMSSRYNRVSVSDLLNDEASGSSSQGAASTQRGIYCRVEGCGRRFVSQEALTAHQKRSHAAPTAFRCPHCGSSFSTAPNLNKHVRYYSHTRWFWLSFISLRFPDSFYDLFRSFRFVHGHRSEVSMKKWSLMFVQSAGHHLPSEMACKGTCKWSTIRFDLSLANIVQWDSRPEPI